MILNGVMALILPHFTELCSSQAHCKKVVEDVVVRKFTFAISSPDEFLVEPCYYRILIRTRTWAGAKRDGRPAEYRWRPLRKFLNSISCTTP